MEQKQNENKIIIYNTDDGKASVSLYAKNGSVWLNQNQLAELFHYQTKYQFTHSKHTERRRIR